jgi:AraC-like DNA-binding protein
VVFSEQDMACPITNPDPTTYQATTSFIDAAFPQHLPPLPVQVRGWVIPFLGTGHCTNEAVAAKCNMHTRILHRRLIAEGTSFQQIKDDIRRDAMLYYIQHTDLEFSSISERLGFAEPSVLTRRCNLWFSAPPTKLRHRARSHAPLNGA